MSELQKLQAELIATSDIIKQAQIRDRIYELEGKKIKRCNIEDHTCDNCSG